MTINNGQKVLKVDVLAEDVTDNRQRLKEAEDRIAALELKVTQLTERVTLLQVAQGIFTAVASTVAAFFGR